MITEYSVTEVQGSSISAPGTAPFFWIEHYDGGKSIQWRAGDQVTPNDTLEAAESSIGLVGTSGIATVEFVFDDCKSTGRLDQDDVELLKAPTDDLMVVNFNVLDDFRLNWERNLFTPSEIEIGIVGDLSETSPEEIVRFVGLTAYRDVLDNLEEVTAFISDQLRPS